MNQRNCISNFSPPISLFSLLRGLAAFDALFLLLAILSFGLPHLSKWYNDTVFMQMMASCFGLMHTFRTGSVYITLAVTFERFHAIIRPLRYFRWVWLKVQNGGWENFFGVKCIGYLNFPKINLNCLNICTI